MSEIPDEIKDEFEQLAKYVDGYNFGDVDLDVAKWTTNAATDFATDVVLKNSPNDGPTAVIVGGQHGIEDAGWLAAEEISKLTPSNGRIKVIARADPTAIEMGQYIGQDGNMNRQWSIGDEPATEQTRNLWGEIVADDPDIVFDLHSSHGIYKMDTGVGQCIFPTPNAEDLAETVRDEMNEQLFDSGDYPDEYEITIGGLQDGSTKGLLSHKIGADLDAKGILFETARPGTTLKDRVAWTKEVVLTCLNELGMEFEESR